MIGFRPIGAALLALVLGGCVYVQEPAYPPYGYAPPLGPNAGAGAAAGALAGGLIGGVAAGPHDRGLGVLGGAAAGALLGGVVGDGLDRDRAAAAAYPSAPYPYADPYPAFDPYALPLE
jgi:hypothetical protein